MARTVSIVADYQSATFAYAASELRSFLERTTNLQLAVDQDGADYKFMLVLDPSLKATSYSFCVAADTTRVQVTLAGHDEACVLHAVYDMLEKCGIFFDVMGPILPAQLNLAALIPGTTVVVTPFVRKRGIRQHINFPMDISSYPLAEALEYIRNLARMRMNHISFHSYNGQWFGYNQDGNFKPGGNFFYGTRLDLPKQELFTRNIRNRSVYCIPEIEAVLDQPERRSRMATEWLNAVIAECKRCGMHVQFSMEPAGSTQAEGVSICRDVLKLYPAIDTLELITPECGNSAKTLTAAELKRYIIELFGSAVMDDPVLANALKDNLHQLEGGLRHCARNIKIVAELCASRVSPLPALAIGAYITCPDSLRILHAVMSRYTPDGVSLSFLPAHGARRAVAHLKQMGFTKQSVSRSMLYGWIEFDGNMYLQQNSVVGAKQMLEFAKGLTGSDQVAGIALNHWRTAENRVCIGYAAQAYIRGPIEPETFYREYAGACGIKDAAHYACIMQELDDLDDLAREKMFNIGFCANGCWVRPGLNWTRRWDNGSIDLARQRFQSVVHELETCLESATSQVGRDHLRFLANRVACSILQLDCAQMLKSLLVFCDHAHPEKLTGEQKAMVKSTCAKAMELTRDYLIKHAEYIVDRGCEGTLISYQTTLPNFIEHIVAVFVDGETQCTHLLPQFDEPPPPMIN